MVNGGLSGDRRAARHRADRGPARAALEDGGRADPLLRRRQRRPARRLSRRRSRAAAAQARQEPAIRAAAARGRTRTICARSGGRDAIAEVIGAARPLADDAVGARDRSRHSFDTPERRAALEARVGEVTAAIGDETVRRYYRQDFTARLRSLLRAAAASACERATGSAASRVAARNWPRRRGNDCAAPRCAARSGAARGLMWWRAHSSRRARCIAAHRTAVPRARGADPAGSAQPPLAAARPPRGTRRARIPPCRRRAAEGGADRHRRPRRGARPRGAAAPNSPPAASPTVHGPDRAARSPPRRSGAAPGGRPGRCSSDLEAAGRLASAMAFPNKELKDAEQALGQDASEANYSWLRDVKARLRR